MIKLVPAILGHTPYEIKEQFEKVADLTNIISFDVADNILVLHATPRPLEFPDPRMGQEIFWHLMVKNPLDYINQCLTFPSGVVAIHAESDLVEKAIQVIGESEALVGLVLNPQTTVESVEQLIKSVDLVQIMTVVPGEQGHKFLPENLAKLKQLRQYKESLGLAVDGGVSLDTIKEVAKYRPDYIVVGSYLTFAQNPKENFDKLVALST